MSTTPNCDDCGEPLSLVGRDRSGPDYICFGCTQRLFRELKEAKVSKGNAPK